MENCIQNTCCFTGHRPQNLPFGFDESHPLCVRLKARLEEKIVFLITQHNVTHFLSGMALGTDQMAAEAVLRLKSQYPAITLECVLPCWQQAGRWTAPQQDRWQQLLKKSDRVTVCAPDYTQSCLIERNRYMVYHSGFVIAVLGSNSHSGAAQTLRYAKARGRTIFQIDPTSYI